MSAWAYSTAWKLAPKIPLPILSGIANIAADIAYLRRGKGITRLKENYRKIRPELSEKQLNALTREGMRSYLRYFIQVFTISTATPEQITARVRTVNEQSAQRAIREHGSAVLGLGHLGNWDLAGAWASKALAPVLAVAEKLEPESLFRDFVNYRRQLGIEILGLGKSGVFNELVSAAANGGNLITLLADRDLTSRGVEVDLCGHRARVAAGPSAVALAAGVPVLGTFIHFERLHGVRRKAAGSPWGIVIHFGDPIPPPVLRDDGDRARVAVMTQIWADQLGEFLKAHTADWHMLQKVFLEDLDAARYAEITGDG